MTWTPYLVSFKMLSPVHIGWKKIEHLQVTRPYVTGKTLWGALTARLVRDEGNNNYIEIGKKVDDELRFTYFYPSTHQDKINLWPWDKKNDFAWRYLGSVVSTAIKGDTAEEGSLHEVEHISPMTRDGNQVFLVGYVIEKNGCRIKWKDTLKRIQLGGERGYGWGRVTPINEPEKSDDCFGYDLTHGGEFPLIHVPEDNPILAHTRADELSLIGTIEPLVGRETTESDGFGGKVSGAEICWVPGSVVKEKNKFQIEAKGIWSKAT